jgi:DNA polymerase (family 10)
VFAAALSRNKEVADLLYKIAKILDMQQVQFKPRAYQRAAVNVESLGEDIEVLVAQDRLGQVPGVGEAIAKKIKEFVETGKLRYYEELIQEVPEGLLAMMSIQGVGPKKALRLYKELQIKNVDELRAALEAHKLRDLKGFGEKSEQEILKALNQGGGVESPRISWYEADQMARELGAYMRKATKAKRVEFAGSYRRGRDTVGDLDLLVEADEAHAAQVIETFVSFGRVRDVMARKGTTGSRVRLSTGLQVDLRVLPKKSFGAALVYFTGSKDHNIALRSLALKKGLTLNEYALAKKEDETPVEGETEEAIYKRLGLAWVPPELRENRGELERAAKGALPKLIEAQDLRGDLHTHTTESDGAHSMRMMLEAAQKLNYEYYGISDHSQALRITNGLDPARLRAQRKQIDKIQDDFPKMRILQGCEVDILKDGKLDLPTQARADLDYVIGSVHSAFNLPKDEQTKRVLAAMDAGIDVYAHPTGRKVLKRPSIELDFEAAADHAAQRGVLLEIDAAPDRIDLWGEPVQVCHLRGAKFVIDSDAHSTQELEFMYVGVVQARRGWLEAKDVLNTQPLATLQKHLGHTKRN